MNKNSGRGSRSARRQETAKSQIPIHRPVPVISKAFRFRVDTADASGSAYTYSQILDLYAMAISATAAYRLCTAVRLRKCEIWACPFSAASAPQLPVVLQIEFPQQVGGSLGGRPQIESSVSLTPLQLAHVSAVPASGTLQSMWQYGSSQPAFVLTCPQGSVVDLHLEFVMQNGETPVAVTPALSGLTTGSVIIVNPTSASTAAAQLQAIELSSVL